MITEPVVRLRHELGFPGMVVLQFALDAATRRTRTCPENHEEQSVVYTGTHDNDTTRGWWDSLDEERARRWTEHRPGTRPAWALIEVAFASARGSRSRRCRTSSASARRRA